MKSLLIKNGHVHTSTHSVFADILIIDQKISKIESNISYEADQILDATGLDIFPGGVDAHTHMELPVHKIFSSDTFKTGSKAAIMGGTTTLIDFANQSKGESLHTTLDKWLKKSDQTYCDYSFHISITDVNDQTLKEIAELVNKGITSFKTFLAYKGMRLSKQEMSLVMDEIKKAGAMITCHCEMGREIEDNISDFIAHNKRDVSYHHQSRPSHLEQQATKNFLDLAIEKDCPAYVVHMTCEDSVTELIKAKKLSSHIYGETCPQYLFLDESIYTQPFEVASQYILSPPLIEKKNQNSLWQAIKNESLDVMATDHCPFTKEQRNLGKDNFTKIPNGLPGVEDRLSLLYSEGILKNNLTYQQFVQINCSNPARIFGLKNKGDIQIGYDGDLCIFNPKQVHTISKETHHMNVDYNCYEGMALQGKCLFTILKGKVAQENGKFLLEKPQGIFLKRDKYNQ